MTINDRIISFNKNRRISKEFNTWKEYENIKEELTELLEAEDDGARVDALCDIIVFATGGLWKLGYDPDKAMSETLLEIEDREQCPIQEREWKTNGANGKWQRNRKQVDCYKAYYKNAREK